MAVVQIMELVEKKVKGDFELMEQRMKMTQ